MPCQSQMPWSKDGNFLWRVCVAPWPQRDDREQLFNDLHPSWRKDGRGGEEREITNIAIEEHRLSRKRSVVS